MNSTALGATAEKEGKIICNDSEPCKSVNMRDNACIGRSVITDLYGEVAT